MNNKNEEKKLGKNVRAERVRQGLSQQELADKTGLSRTHVSDIERGKRNPTFPVIKKIAEILGVTIGELAGEGIESENIPDELEKLAEEQKLPTKHIEMLKNIEYRGKQPKSKAEWASLYNFIKATLEEK